jgi:triosephosphate isomerase (TIM)
MTKPILVANWKNHPGSLREAGALLKGLKKDAQLYKKIRTFIAPPAVYFPITSDLMKSSAPLASQDISSQISGTHTGEVTPDILKSFGVRLAILGHSERRAMGETSEMVSNKVKIAQKSGFIALVCVGEKERDQDGDHFESLRQEIRASLSGISRENARQVLIAYEPIWAIGKKAKDAMSASDLSQTIIFIKKVLTDLYGREVADGIPIIYGGSVEASNAEKLCKEGGVAGFLVGHASLDYKSFKTIAEMLLTK